MKRCPKCGEQKPLEDFYKESRASDGKATYCKECARAVAAAWYKANPEKAAANSVVWATRNSEKHLAYIKAWAKANPEAKAATRVRNRAKRYNAPGTCTADQIRARFDYYGGQCYLKLDGCLGVGKTPEHVIPLSKGGSNWPANIRPACMPCNLKKLAKPLSEVI